jgi:heme/copper-type cytochrome/quinol oxidase subunit 2
MIWIIGAIVLGVVALLALLIVRRRRRIAQGLPVWHPGDFLRKWRERRQS